MSFVVYPITKFAEEVGEINIMFISSDDLEPIEISNLQIKGCLHPFTTTTKITPTTTAIPLTGKIGIITMI